MEDKELYEILQDYADATRGDKEEDLKKLHEKQREQEEVKNTKTTKRFKPQYIFAATVCVIVIVLCISLPIALTDNPQEVNSTYCTSDVISLNNEGSIDVLVNKYHIYANYPTYTTTPDCMAVCSISSYIDSRLHGAFLGYVIEDDNLIFIEIAIVPKTHILQTYEKYFSLPNKSNWNGREIRFIKKLNKDTQMFDIQVYFEDDTYDYFVKVESEFEEDVFDILNLLYS